MQSLWKQSLLIAALVSLAACGKSNSVEGNTYEANGGVLKIEFQSGGKAVMSMGPMAGKCTYTQSGKTVSLACENDKMELTVNDDGSLAGPPNGFASRLTKKNG